MIIGFDAKRAFQNKTGLGNYSRTLLESFMAYYPQNEYALFAPKKTSLFNPLFVPKLNVITPQWQPAKQLPSLWRSLWMTRDLKKNGIRLYHGLSNELPPGASKAGIRTVVTIHDLIFERYPKLYHTTEVWSYKRKFRQACRQADAIIATSRQTKQDIVDFYDISPEKIHVCYQSCDPAYTRLLLPACLNTIRQRYQLPEQFFLSVGSIIERKRLKLICEALYNLQPQLDIPLIVIGQGKQYKKEIQQWLAEKGMSSQVIFLADQLHGKVNEQQVAQDLPGIYQLATAFLYPSIFEGFGIPVLEGLQSRIPVITTNASSLPEVGGDAAIYIEPDDLDGLADAMWQVATNTGLMEIKKRQAVIHLRHFSMETTASANMEVYRSLL